MKSSPKSKLGQVGVGWNIFLKINRVAHRKSYVPIRKKSLPKVKLGQVGVGSNIAQNHSYRSCEVISGHYLPQFT